MKVVLLQTDIEWLSPQKNREHISDLTDDVSEADLIVLPEMFTTGFCTSPEGAAEYEGAETFAWMKNTAARTGAAIAGSVAIEEDGHYYNRFYFVKPDGTYTAYDKRHLFSFGGEHKKYTSGRERVIVEHAGFRILLQVCYDLRFPVFSRNRGDYDMILYVASWPVPRIGAWNTLLRARAIENQCYVAGINRTGKDPYCEYNGGTVLIDYLGNDISAAETEAETTVRGLVDMEPLKDFRKKFPALDDADNFEIKYPERNK